MTCNFRIGQKVVCIDAGELMPSVSADWNGDAPCKGEIYTIRDMKPSQVTLAGVPVIILFFKEIRRAKDPWLGYELGYWHVRFRALEERGDGLGVLKEILLDPSRPVSGDEGPVRQPAKERERA